MEDSAGRTGMRMSVSLAVGSRRTGPRGARTARGTGKPDPSTWTVPEGSAVDGNTEI